MAPPQVNDIVSVAEIKHFRGTVKGYNKDGTKIKVKIGAGGGRPREFPVSSVVAPPNRSEKNGRLWLFSTGIVTCIFAGIYQGIGAQLWTNISTMLSSMPNQVHDWIALWLPHIGNLFR